MNKALKKKITQKISAIITLSPEDIQKKIIDKAVESGECDIGGLETWFENRFSKNLVTLNQNDYTEVCISSLKTLFTLSATDFGSSRQRDLGQLWADTIRGYLGEIAVQKFLKEKFNLSVFLDHEKGDLSDYLDSDIKAFLNEQNVKAVTNAKISIKSTKWSGVWLDILGAQFRHSDYYILVKLGIGRDHLFAFFREISIFKDKILPLGIKQGGLSEAEADKIFTELPVFSEIPAYISGFIKTDDIKENEYDYNGKKGKKHYNITGYRGRYQKKYKQDIAREQDLPNGGEVKFCGIGDFNHEGYIFNVGSLKYAGVDWRELIQHIQSK